ncbi:MAG: transporter substrate-binding domain-containing protein [Sneathiella sp.]
MLLLTAPNVYANSNCTSFSANGINNWYPFVYRTNDGELTGTIVDGTKAALSQLGLGMTVQDDVPWKRILYNLEKGTLDMVIGGYWNSERAGKYHYSDPLGTDDVRVFVRPGDEFPLASLEDLIGKNGFNLLGGSYGDEFDEFSSKHLNLSNVSKSDQIIRMVAAGRGDYGIVGYVEALEHIRLHKLEGKVVALPWPVLSTDVHVLINRDAACANKVGEINAVIRDLREKGVLQNILDKHLKAGQPIKQ